MGFVTAKDRPFTTSSFAQFIPDADEREPSLAVVNRDAPEPLQNLLERLFEGQLITVGEVEREDETGPKTVYERLAAGETDTHVYGIPDWTPEPSLELTAHGGWSDDFRDVWFVVHIPADESRRHAALVAVQTEPGSWEAVWTYGEKRVREINRYIERTL